MSQLRYVRARGDTMAEMRRAVRQSELYKLGDCVLVWVNEGDFWSLFPTEVDEEKRREQEERLEYWRLREKYG